MTPSPPRDTAGFSLVELLAVIAIVAIAMAMILPAMDGMLTGSKITDTGTRLAALIERGRMHATTSQSMVAFRIFENPADTNSPKSFDAVALVELKPVSGDPLGLTTNMLAPLFRFPAPVIISHSLSSLFDTNSGAGAGSALIPGGGTNQYVYRDFLILPDGSTSLKDTSPNPHLCLVSSNDTGVADQEPDNPYVISIDPETGRITAFRK